MFEIRHFKVKERLVLELNKIELENLNKEKKIDYLVTSFKINNEEYLKIKNIIQERVIAILTGINLF